MFEMKGKYTTAKIMIDSVEESCVGQIQRFLNHPVFTNSVAVMPDCHSGKGSVIGFTMPMVNKIIPDVIGVDIGCGVKSINIGQTIPISLQELDHKIRQRVPFGFCIHENSILDMKKEFPWRKVNFEAQKFILAYQEKFGFGAQPPHFDMNWFTSKCQIVGCDLGRAIKSLGTIGSGNHFCEVGISTKNEYWLTIHTGSRNFGKCICEYWQNQAIKKIKRQSKEESKEAIRNLKAQFTGKELYDRIKALKAIPEQLVLPSFGYPDELRWLESEEAIYYLYDMIFAQIYAETNRNLILKLILDILKLQPKDSIESVHNFIDFRDFIIRKGAIRSYIGETMVIPFNMRDGILVCEGRSNPEWNYSAPHGAGRVMSRSQAKRSVDLDRFKGQMEGIYSTSVGEGTLDEAPDAYKDSRVIEDAIGATAVIIDRIKPIHNMKDSLGDRE